MIEKMEKRDIVNAPELRESIISRSQQRRDDAEITRWLSKKFYDYLLKDFHPVFVVNSIEAWKSCLPQHPIPEWFSKKLIQQPDAHMLYIDPFHEKIIELERPIVEFFQSRLQSNIKGRFMNMTLEQVMQAWHKDHEAMKKRLAKGKWDSSPQAVKSVFQGKTGQFFEIDAIGQLLRQEMAYESWHIQHCLGQFEDLTTLHGGYGEQYVQAKEQGEKRYFSLRDEFNKPHVTISLEFDGEHWSVEQIKGKQNDVPIQKYADDVLDFLNDFKPINAQCYDTTRMGILYKPELQEQKEVDAEDENHDQPIYSNKNIVQFPAQKQQQTDQEFAHLKLYFYFHELKDSQKIEKMVLHNPMLMEHCPRQSASLQWLFTCTQQLDKINHDEHLILDKVHRYFDIKSHTNRLSSPLHFQDEAKNPFWRQILLLPCYLLAALLMLPSQIPILGWLFKLPVMICGLLINLISVKDPTLERKKWALATGNIIYHRMKINDNDGELKNEAFLEHKAFYIQHLEKELNIQTQRADKRKWRMQEFLNTEYFTVNRLTDLYQYYKIDGYAHARDLMVFHHIQKIFLIRLLVQFEELPEEQAWQYIFASAQLIQDCCDSWQTLGKYYAQGREMELMMRHNDQENFDRSGRMDVENYLEGAFPTWKSLSWRTPLFEHIQPRTFQKIEATS